MHLLAQCSRKINTRGYSATTLCTLTRRQPLRRIMLTTKYGAAMLSSRADQSLVAGAVVVAAAWLTCPSVCFAADAAHPYSNIDPRVDAGNDTGDAQVEALNQAQLDSLAIQPRQYASPPGYYPPPQYAPSPVYYYPPPGYGPPAGYYPPPRYYPPPGYWLPQGYYPPLAYAPAPWTPPLPGYR